MNYLLLRGLARSGAHWYEFAETLAARSGGRVERLDVAGCGTESARLPRPSVPWLARDVARRWDSVPSGRARGGWAVIGLSLGGMIALELCRVAPQRFEHAVIINASSRATPATERLSTRGVYDLLLALASSDELARERRVLALTSSLPEQTRRGYAERAARIARERPMSRAAVLAQLLGAARFVPPPPSELSLRLTFVCSRGDQLVSPRCTRDLSRLYGSPSIEHPWAGHDLPLDDPEWLCARVVALERQGTAASA